ncbi:MAG TPA: hypothetical protein VIX37_11245, partial [Candidatus Sulfotelmatobacter sp.]
MSGAYVEAQFGGRYPRCYGRGKKDMSRTGNVLRQVGERVVKDGDELRITAPLVDVKPDKLLWREAIDLKYDKLLTVQDRVSLSPTEAASLKPEKPINAIAYEDYLRGIDFYSLNEFAAAIDMLEKAATIEPKYAPTWAHLGRAYMMNVSLQFGGREDNDKAQAAYEKAIALNPALVEPRIYMANLFT